jgi:ABC-2 type transport system permease protein
MLGGCIWPLRIVPSAVRTLGYATPHAWHLHVWRNPVAVSVRG